MEQSEGITRSQRIHLPDERPSHTHKFSIAGHEGYLHVGLYPDDFEIQALRGWPGEIFITLNSKSGFNQGVLNCFAISVSRMLQHQISLEELCNRFSHMRFPPSGFTNNKQIPVAKSVVDYVFRYLALRFLGEAPSASEEEGSRPESSNE